jgi:hypothetical protein
MALVLYALFYSAGFSFPYAVFLFAFYDYFHLEKYAADRVELRTNMAFLSLACLITFLVFLRSEIAFLQCIPTDVWNGWLMLVWILAAGFVTFGTYGSIKGIVGNSEIRIPNGSKIYCYCSGCGNEWLLPADHLRAENIVIE